MERETIKADLALGDEVWIRAKMIGESEQGYPVVEVDTTAVVEYRFSLGGNPLLTLAPSSKKGWKKQQ